MNYYYLSMLLIFLANSSFLYSMDQNLTDPTLITAIRHSTQQLEIQQKEKEENERQKIALQNEIDTTLTHSFDNNQECSEDTLKQIAALPKSNQQWKIIFADKSLSGKVIKQLSDNYRNIQHVTETALDLIYELKCTDNHTGSLAWLKNYIKDKSRSQQALCSLLYERIKTAAIGPEIGRIRILVETGINLNIPISPDDKFNRNYSDFKTPLTLAAYVGNSEIVKLLINYQADANLLSLGSNNSPLIAAAYCLQQENVEIVAALLTHQATVNAQNNKGNTALIIAAQKGKYDLVNLLLQNNALAETHNYKNKIAEDKVNTAIKALQRSQKIHSLGMNNPTKALHNLSEEYNEKISAPTLEKYTQIGQLLKEAQLKQ